MEKNVIVFLKRDTKTIVKRNLFINFVDSIKTNKIELKTLI